jgi:hypothetical protein
MDNEKLQVVFPEGSTVAELVIREGESQNILDLKPPVKVNLSGVIGSPYEFLQRRINRGQFEIDRCVLIVDREDVSMLLIINDNDEYLKGSVLGQLTKHPKFTEFGINSGKSWDVNELGQFLKMNKVFFSDKTANMTLVAQLKNFVADIAVKAEKEKNENGSFKDNYSGLVTTNLPGSFLVNLPIFKGVPAEQLEVEFYCSVNGRSIELQLFSPGAVQLLEEMRDEVIDEQIKLFRELAPDIAIIEK